MSEDEYIYRTRRNIYSGNPAKQDFKGSLTRLVEFKDAFGKKIWIKPELVEVMRYLPGTKNQAHADLFGLKINKPYLIIQCSNGSTYHVSDPKQQAGDKINQALAEARAIHRALTIVETADTTPADERG